MIFMIVIKEYWFNIKFDKNTADLRVLNEIKLAKATST